MAQKKKKKPSKFSQLPKKPAVQASLAPQIKGEAKIAAPAAQPAPDLPMELASIKPLWESGRRDAALAMLAALPDSQPGDAPLLEELGRLAMVKKDFDTAAAFHRRWVNVEPNNGRAYNALGASLVSGEWLEAAQAALQQAVALSPDISTYHFNLAKLYMVRAMWNEARTLLTGLQFKFPQEQGKIDELFSQFPSDA